MRKGRKRGPFQPLQLVQAFTCRHACMEPSEAVDGLRTMSFNGLRPNAQGANCATLKTTATSTCSQTRHLEGLSNRYTRLMGFCVSFPRF